MDQFPRNSFLFADMKQKENFSRKKDYLTESMLQEFASLDTRLARLKTKKEKSIGKIVQRLVYWLSFSYLSKWN